MLPLVRVRICDHHFEMELEQQLSGYGEVYREREVFDGGLGFKAICSKKDIARQRSVEFVHEGCLNPSSPWEQLRALVAYGSEVFLDGLRSHLKGQALAEEIPTVQRHAGRLQLTELFNGAAREGKAQKEADIINKAQLEFGTRRSRQPLTLACTIRR